MAHSLDTKRLNEVFDGIEKHEDELTEWEAGFFHSVRGQWIKGKQLSDAQLERLEEIWCRRVP